MKIWLLGWVCRWACELYDDGSRAVVRCSALYVGSAREASGLAVLVYGMDPKVASLGSWDMYYLALNHGQGHGVVVYDSFDMEADADRVV